MGIKTIERKGFEADDVIATLADKAARAGMRTTIVSSDKDFAQCVKDGMCEIVDPMANRRVLEKEVEEKFGVPPAFVPQVQALAGDTIDGIPGVDGCGLKVAGALLRRFGSLEDLLERGESELTDRPLIRAQIRRQKDRVRLFLKLTTLRKNVPLGKFDFENYVLKPVLREHVETLLKRLEASEGYRLVFTREFKLLRSVERIDSPLEWWTEELAVSGQPIPELPQCGFYQRRLVRGGPFVPARIWREPEIDPVTGIDSGRDVLRCEVGGKARDPCAEWGRLAMNPVRKSEYDYQRADHEHARKYRPGDPKATPTRAIVITQIPAVRNPRRQES
jgi:hypothetical protein